MFEYAFLLGELLHSVEQVTVPVVNVDGYANVLAYCEKSSSFIMLI